MNPKRLVGGLPLVVAIALIGYGVFNKGSIEPRSVRSVGVREGQDEGFPAEVVPGSIHDGDTLRVTSSAPELAKYADDRGEIKVRFACIDAPEKEQKYGVMARDRLRSILRTDKSALARSGKVTIDPVDVDRYGRVVAELWDEDGLVQSHLVLAGAAFPYERYKQNCRNWDWDAVSYSAKWAKEQRLGVWADGVPEYPWEWRRRRGE